MPVDFAALLNAHATLNRGAAQVTLWRNPSHAGEGNGSEGNRGALIRTRMVGNCLRELDRFLSVCMDETALHLDASGPLDSAFPRLRNTPNKLRLVEARIGAMTSRHVRLRAIGRISACLHHCSGHIHDPGLHGDVALAHGAGWDVMPPMEPPRTEMGKLNLTGSTIIRIGAFYREIAEDLLAGVRRATPIIDFSGPTCNLKAANVACDGI